MEQPLGSCSSGPREAQTRSVPGNPPNHAALGLSCPHPNGGDSKSAPLSFAALPCPKGGSGFALPVPLAAPGVQHSALRAAFGSGSGCQEPQLIQGSIQTSPRRQPAPRCASAISSPCFCCSSSARCWPRARLWGRMLRKKPLWSLEEGRGCRKGSGRAQAREGGAGEAASPRGALAAQAIPAMPTLPLPPLCHPLASRLQRRLSPCPPLGRCVRNCDYRSGV